MRTLRSVTVLALSVLACEKPSQSPAQGGKGKVRMAFSTAPASSSGLVLPAICGTFTLTPFQIASGQLVAAGDPIVVQETAPGQTGFIAGCIDSTASGNDWAYTVSATGWAPCDPNAPLDPSLSAYLAAHHLTLQQFLASISPGTASTEVQLNCTAGLDVAAQVSVDVSVPVENAAGYVDISVSVNATEVEIGCKQAEFQSNVLHFGSSWMGAIGASAPDGVWGISSNGSATQQFTGQVTAGQLDQYDTGLMTFAGPGPTTIVQTFTPHCAGYFGAASQPLCTTTALYTSGPKAPHATTIASIADAYISEPEHGWATATVQADQSTLLINTGLSLSYIPSGPSPSNATPAVADQLAPTFFSDPSIAQFTGLWPALDAYGFVFTYLDASGAGLWGHLLFDAMSSTWSLGAVHPLSGMSDALASCVGLFGQGTAGCQGNTQNACGALVLASYPPRKIVQTRALVKYETAIPIRVTDYVPHLSGALYLPDASGALVKRGDLLLAASARSSEAGSGTALREASPSQSLKLSASLDCSSAIAGHAQGYAVLSMDSLDTPAGGLAPLGDLPRRLVPVNCDAPSDISAELSVRLAGVDASGKVATLASDATGAMVGQSAPQVTCATDAAGNTTASFGGNFGLSDGFPGSPTPSGYLVNTCYNGSEEVPCSSLELNNEPWIDSRVAGGTPQIGYHASLRTGRNRRVEFVVIPSTKRQEAAGAYVQYGATAMRTTLPANDDGSCTGATTEAAQLGTLVSGLNSAGSSFLYSLGIDNAARMANLRFSADAHSATAGTPVLATNAAGQSVDLGRNTVLDTCIDPSAPGTAYLRTHPLMREPTDPDVIQLAVLSVDLLSGAASVDLAPASDKVAAAQQCQSNRDSGRSAQPLLSFGADRHVSQPSPSPGPSNFWSCFTDDDVHCVCFGSNGGIAFGSVGGWAWNTACRISIVFPTP